MDRKLAAAFLCTWLQDPSNEAPVSSSSKSIELRTEEKPYQPWSQLLVYSLVANSQGSHRTPKLTMAAMANIKVAFQRAGTFMPETPVQALEGSRGGQHQHGADALAPVQRPAVGSSWLRLLLLG